MAGYGAKASEKVEKAMQERQAGTFETWLLGRAGEKQEAGDRDRPPCLRSVAF
jgi:hypothetical protein